MNINKKGLKEILLRAIISVIVAFQFCGYDLFFSREFSLFLCVLFILCVVLVYWGIKAIVRLLDWVADKKVTVSVSERSVERSEKVLYVFSGLLAIGILAELIIFFAYYPGIYSQDVVQCWRQSLDLSAEKSDLHSFLYVCLLAVFSYLTNNIAIVTVFFALSFAIVFALFMTYLWKNGLRLGYTLCSTILFYIFPNNLYMIVALWKDIPFTIALVSLTYALCKWVFEPEHVKESIGCLVHIGVSAVCVACFRSNGLVILASLLIFFCLLWFRKHSEWKMLVSLLAAVIVVSGFKGPVFSLLNVDRGPEGFACVPLIDAVWANAYYGVELPADAEQVLSEIIVADEWKTEYVEGYANVYIWEDAYWNKKLSFKKSLEWYVWCISNHPLLTIKARLTKTDFLWNYFMCDGAYLSYNCDFKASQNPLASEYGWSYLEGTQGLRNAFAAFFYWFHNLAVLYRGAIHLTLWLILILEFRKKNTSAVVVILPALANAIALFIACCYSDYRFIWNMEVMSFFIIPVYLLTHRKAQELQLNDI